MRRRRDGESESRKDRSRRGFLRSVLASSGLLLLPACDVRPPDRGRPDTGSRALSELDWELLRAVARDVLPTELGDDGVEDVVRRFRDWLEDYQPGVERDHGYLTAELSHTPEDPTSRWAIQLEELDEGGSTYSQSSLTERQRRLLAAVRAVGTERPMRPSSTAADPPEPGESDLFLSTANAIRAPHVVLALLAFFFSSPQATDLCFQAPIGPLTCRELSQASARPG